MAALAPGGLCSAALYQGLPEARSDTTLLSCASGSVANSDVIYSWERRDVPPHGLHALASLFLGA